MRFFELGTKIGIERKDIDILKNIANQDGFDIKSSLALVDESIVEKLNAWVDKNADELVRKVGEEKSSEKPAPVKKRQPPSGKKAPARKVASASTAEQAPAPKENEPVEEVASAKLPTPPAGGKTAVMVSRNPHAAKPAATTAEAPTAAPAAPVVEVVRPEVVPVVPEPPVAPEAPAPQVVPVAPQAAKPATTLGKRDAGKSGKFGKAQPSYKPNQNQPKKAQAKEIKISRPVVQAPSTQTGPGLVIEDAKSGTQQQNVSLHKYKQADFKGTLSRPELPPIFSSMDSEYTRSIRSTGGHSRGRGAKGGSGASGFSRRKGGRRGQAAPSLPRDPNAISELSKAMSVRDLSVALGIKLNAIISYLMQNEKMLAVNDILGEEDIVQIAEQFEIPYAWKQEENLEELLKEELQQEQDAGGSEAQQAPRPPVVTFMGHVDHGKTSLLDKIRQTRVTEGESGGITQHIGAYSITKNGHRITFLDTPGHEAFTQMRARGANLTDIVVLVVAADDGVMPQTREAYSHAKNAGVPVVVALNKCDMAGANPDKVRQELANQLELMPEEWGGHTGMIEVSAITGDGVEQLLERILLESEMLELSSNPNRKAVGYVIESEMTENRGAVATVLVLDGTLHRGDVLLTSNGYGKVKLMYDSNGKTTHEGGPSQAVSVVGLNNVPEVGDKIFVVDDMSNARKLAEEREHKARDHALTQQKRTHVTLENLTSYLEEGQKQELNIIVKADVSGSLEVLIKTLADLATDEVSINVIHSGVGGISQADVILADASDALIVGFHVVPDSTAKLQASSHGVQIKVYHIIYRLIEDMKAALEGMLPPEERELIRGQVEIREVFHSSKLGNIAGCYVTDGYINRTCKVRVIRDSIVVHTGNIDGLRRFKDDVKEVRNGFECGMRIVGFDAIRVGDILEPFEIEEVARKLK